VVAAGAVVVVVVVVVVVTIRMIHKISSLRNKILLFFS
jgi:hypothetical protein